MGFLHNLKARFKDVFPKLESFINIQIITNSNVDCKFEAKDDSKTLSINLAKFTPEEKGVLRPLLVEALDESGGILKDDARALIEDFRKTEELPDVRERLAYFEKLIPPGDVRILRSALFLRKRFEDGESIAHLKSRMVEAYGQRGNNIANLCSAGYFEDWLEPLYEQLKESEDDEASAIEKFRAVYGKIVEELPWTVFVSHKMEEEDIEAQIVEKINKNLKYGLRWVNIHGLGDRNVKRVRNAIEIIEGKHDSIRKEVTEEGTRIFVRLKIGEGVMQLD